ncbi:MAG: hypothetical protein GXY01_06960 [Clostridiales bacterium]|nr:hypothetical protein [Clostridiales bacterium]
MKKKIQGCKKRKSVFYKRAPFFALIMIFALLSGCGSIGGTGEKNADQTEKENTETAYDDKTEEETDYKELYLDKVTEFVGKYGEYDIDPDTQAVNGVKYGELIDFENDGVPEMLLICNRTAYIFGCVGSDIVELLNTPIGTAFGCTDVSYFLNISEVDGKTYIIADNTTAGWSEDNWTAFTVEDGAVTKKQFFAKTDGNNDYPDIEFLNSFYIDGSEVSSEEYLSQRSLLRENARSIDAVWADYSATHDELNSFKDSIS